MPNFNNWTFLWAFNQLEFNYGLPDKLIGLTDYPVFYIVIGTK